MGLLAYVPCAKLITYILMKNAVRSKQKILTNHSIVINFKIDILRGGVAQLVRAHACHA